MSVQEKKAQIKRSYEGGMTEEEARALIAPGYVIHNPMTKRDETLDEHAQFEAQLLSAFPDLHFTVEELIGEGDLVAVRWRARGAFTGAFMGRQPTGKVVEMTGISIHRFEGGKGAECWIQMDSLGLLQQVGVVPELAAVPV